MGTFLSKLPVTHKTSIEGTSKNLCYGLCEMQGWRTSMEDAAICAPNFEKGSSLFGILDGHGGGKISRFVADNFLDLLLHMRAYRSHDYEQALIETFLKFDELLRIDKIDSCLKQNDKVKIIFTTSIEDLCDKQLDTTSQPITLKTEIPLDKIIDLTKGEYCTPTSGLLCKENSLSKSKSLSIPSTIEDSPLRFKFRPSYKKNEIQININNSYSLSSRDSLISNEMGTTANILLIKDNYMYIANVGDSAAYMFRNGQAIMLTQEHKPNLPCEYDRIIKSGAEVVRNRINGKLNLTRAIGDLSLKNNPELKFYEQAVIAFPEINKLRITNDIEFVVMACDGVWDCVSPQLLCEHISKRLADEVRICDIIKDIFDKIISETNNRSDNMSCIIIQLKHLKKNI